MSIDKLKEDRNKKDKSAGKPKTESPISEKDEVKAAEKRTQKAQANADVSKLKK